MARCHRPEWLAAVRKERLMTEQRLATAKGHHSQLTVEKGKAHIRLSFGRPLYPATRPELIQNRNARWRGRKCHDPWQRYAVSHPSLLRASDILFFSNLSQMRRRADSDLSSNWIVANPEAIHMSEKSNRRMTLIRQQIAPPAERYPAISLAIIAYSTP